MFYKYAAWHSKRAELQFATMPIQRWNPEGWCSERLTLCFYLLAELVWVAGCHMAPGYTAKQSQIHQYAQRSVLVLMIHFPEALPKVQRQQWTSSSQVLRCNVIDTMSNRNMLVFSLFIIWLLPLWTKHTSAPPLTKSFIIQRCTNNNHPILLLFATFKFISFRSKLFTLLWR